MTLKLVVTWLPSFALVLQQLGSLTLSQMQPHFDASVANNIMKTLWQIILQLYFGFIAIFHIFAKMFPRSSTACLLYVGKGRG